MHRARVVRRNGFLLLGAAAVGLFGFAARADESAAPARAASSRHADRSSDALLPKPSHLSTSSKKPQAQSVAASNPTVSQTGSVPVLSFASYFGRTVNDQVNSIALGTDGSSYVAGVTGPMSATATKGQAFIAHVSADGSSLLYMVDLGGSAQTEARAIAVDASGNAYITGVTYASDFPVHNALQATCSLNSKAACSGDAFLTKLNPDGSIAFSTFLGGSGQDAANAITLDAAGNIYIAGSTASTDFPVFKPLQATSGGQGDAFLAKISADGSHVLFATYLGGSGADEARGLALDSLGNLYVTGQTFSHDFPLEKALQPSYGLNAQKVCSGTAFVAKLTPDGSSLTYSTYLGGTGGEAGNAIAVDASGSAYITGATTSVDFPVAKPFQSVAHGGSEAFVSKLSPDGSSLVYSTYLGGKADDTAFAIAIDKSGNAYVSGVTDSPDLPVFTPVQAACAKSSNGTCSQDAFVAVLDPTGARLEFSTYLGGTSSDNGRGIVVDPTGAVMLAGATTSVDFPAAKRVLLANPASGGSSTTSAQTELATSTTPGGGLVAKLTGLRVVGGNGGLGGAQPEGMSLCTGNSTNWLGGTGNWSNAAMWSTGAVPNSTTVNVCIDNGNAINSVVTLDITVNVGTLTIDSGDTLIVADNIDFFLNGNISNSGLLQLSSAGDLVRLRLSTNVQLSGGGTVTFSNSTHNGNAIIRGEGGGITLTNVDNTIQGEGQIGNGTGLTVVNQTAGTIDANSTGQILLFNSGTVTNAGALEATNGGVLQIPVLVVNAGSNIQSNGTGSAVQLQNGSTIRGGTLTTANGGAMGVVNGAASTLDGATSGAVKIVGTLNIGDNSDLFVSGTLNNTGTILFNSVGDLCRLRLSTSLQLTGGGTLTLTNTAHNGNAIIRGETAGITLTNVDNTIQGEGQIGNGTGLLVTIQANATFDANSMGQILLFNSGTVTNLGTLEATNGGVLQIPVLVVNTGRNIQATGTGSALQLFSGSTIQAGTLTAANGGVMGVVGGQESTLDGTTTGAVTIAGIFTVPDNSDLFVSGTLNNTGTLQLNSAGDLCRLRLSTSLQLMGGGTVTLSNTAHNGNAIIRGEGGGVTLTNADNTIQGEGQIGNGTGLLVMNQAAGIVDANSTGQILLLNSGTFTNVGTLEATNGGVLQIPILVVDTGSSIQANGAGSALQLFSGSTIQGGSLSVSGGGVMGVVAGQESTLDGKTSGAVTIVGTFTVPDNSDLFAAGTLNNTGTISLSSQGNLCRLRLTSNLQLMGGGTVTLSNAAHNGNTNIRAEGGFTLTNVDNTIQGEGQIGNATGLAVTNQSTIDANVSTRVLLLNGAGGVTNAGGLLEATAGGILQIGATSITLNNKSGTIQVSGMTSAVQFVSGSTIQGGTLNTLNGGVLGVAGGQTVTLDGTAQGQVTNAGTFTVADNSDLFIVGTLNNTGTLLLSSTGDLTRLRLNANLTITGGGTVTLANSAHNANAIIRAEGNFTLTNSNNTIQGEGQIGNGTGLAVLNQSTIEANVSGQSLLFNGGGVLTNAGILEAVGGGILQVGTTTITINNKGGTIKDDGAGSAVQLFNGTTLQGGTLTTANGGVLGVAGGQTITLDGTTQGAITNAGTFTVADNADLYAMGTLNNTGTLLLNSTGDFTRLRLPASLTITGGGTVTLANSAHNGNAIIRAEGGFTLTNANNTIQGEGQIGNGTGLIVVNQSTIVANVSKQSLLFNGSGGVSNPGGLLDAVGGGILQVGTVAITINNSGGTIKDDGATSAVQLFNGTTIQGGTLTTANGGVLGVAGGQSITLDGTAQGAITNAGTFTVADNADLYAIGTLNNTGTLLLNSMGNLTRLRIPANLTITGGGTVTLANSAHNGNAIIRAEGPFTLTNANNTIQGEGQIGNGTGLIVVNQSTIVANVSKQSLLFNGSGGVSNPGGLLDAVGGGILQVGTLAIVINNSGGTIKDDGASSAVQLFNGTTIQGGTLTTANSGVLGVAGGQSITLDGTAQGPITNAGTFTVADNADLFVVGTLNNTGTLLLNSMGNLTRLRLLNNVMITGGGTITLANSAHNGNAIIRAEGGFTLTNANNTIQGEGQIGNGTGLIVVNQSTIVANVAKQSLLFNGNGGVSNPGGLLDAVGGGILQVGTIAITINNNGGTIKDDGTGSAVQLFNGTTIQGGTLTTANGGLLGVTGGQSITLDGTAQGPLTNAGTFTVADNADLFAVGTLNNTGTLLLNSMGNLTRLRLSNNVMITGAGTITLANSSHNGNAIIRAEGAFTLTNVANTIQGEGQIGNGTALLVTNQGTINSNVSGQTLSFNGSGALSNAGLLEASTGSTLQLGNAALNNTGGVLKVDGTLVTPAGFDPMGGTLDGAGNISGSLVSGGVLQPGDAPAPGIFTINGTGGGNYTIGSGGAFDVPIGGTTAGTQFSQLNITGTAMLAGTLNVTLINGFTPAQGNQFTIITAGAVAGTFATTNFPSLPAGLIWNIAYNPTSVQLSIAQGQGTVALSPSPANFGNQRVNTTSTPLTVTLTNNGTGALTLATTGAVQISGTNAADFALTSGTTCTNGATVAKGATCLILLTFKPAAVGARTATLTVTDSATPATQTVTLDGTGTAPIATPAPSPLVFAAEAIGTTSAPLTITVTNTGTDTLHFAAGANPLAISGTNAPDFAIVPTGTTCTGGSQVLPDATCSIAVTFKASIAGSETATLTITDDSGAVAGSTQMVPLMGTGNGPAVTLNPTSAAFPATPLNTTSAPLTITLTNSGTTTLNINSNVTITGANAGDFAVGQGTTCTVETSLQAGTSCAIVFTFTPSANGARSATATITDNATPGTQTIALSGATPSLVSLSTNALTFANQGVGNASPVQTVTLTNIGGGPLTFTGAPTITGTNATDFSIVAASTTCSTATPVAVGGTCTIGVSFTPSATGSRGPATLNIFDGASGPNGAPVPAQTVTLTGTGVTFAIAGPSGPVIVQPGQLATFPITVTPGPNGFTGPITFCATAVAPATCFPQGVAAEFPQPTQTPSGNSITVTLWVFTTGPGGSTTPAAAPPVSFHRPSPPMLWLYALASFLAAALFLVLLNQQKFGRGVRRVAVLVPALALLIGVLTVAGCGGGGSGSSTSTFTPAGTFQVLVTATSGTTVRTTIVTVQVQ